ncbi:MAG: hypothetical protein QOI40_4991, partial [Alphaproteobacteria bacterium]|nr:hypothetical protein [Alphaproteobacteria bacterium]
MANTPKKMKDPTEAALSAIQDALTVRDTTPEPITPSSPAATQRDTQRDESVSDPPWRTLRSQPQPQSHQEMYDDNVHPDEDSLRRPANDDRESIGQILRTIQRRPARTSYIVATVFAAI